MWTGNSSGSTSSAKGPGGGGMAADFAEVLSAAAGSCSSLIAMPAPRNFSGVRSVRRNSTWLHGRRKCGARRFSLELSRQKTLTPVRPIRTFCCSTMAACEFQIPSPSIPSAERKATSKRQNSRLFCAVSPSKLEDLNSGNGREDFPDREIRGDNRHRCDRLIAESLGNRVDRRSRVEKVGFPRLKKPQRRRRKSGLGAGSLTLSFPKRRKPIIKLRERPAVSASDLFLLGEDRQIAAKRRFRHLQPKTQLLHRQIAMLLDDQRKTFAPRQNYVQGDFQRVEVAPVL